MADERRVGMLAAFIVAALGVICCVLPALVASGFLAAAAGRLWFGVGILLLALAGWIWRQRSRLR